MKFYNINLLLSILVIAFTSCGNEAKTTLAQKKASLDSLRKEIAKLQAKEKLLSDEIALLDSNATNLKLVETVVLASSKFISELEVEGIVDATNSTIATSKLPGTVTSVNVEVGQRVSKGQILATLDNSTLLKSKMELEQQLTFATTLYEKQYRLWKNGIGTEVQYLSAKNQKEALEKSLNTLNSNLDMYNIKSPINGSIEASDLKVGQIAAPGMPYFKVMNLSDIKVNSQISESYAQKVNSGDVVTVVFPDLKEEVKSKISFASNFIDPLNRTFKIEVKVNGVKSVKPNMIAKLKITDYVKEKAIVVPSNAIQKTESETFVMLLIKDGKGFKAEKRLIVTGKTNRESTEIVEGLSENDELIVNGFQELSNDQKIGKATLK